MEFMKKWGSSFGIYGEQGVEGLHATFNSMKLSYRTMHPASSRLKAMLSEHFMRVNPESASLRPKQVKRKYSEQ